MLIVVAPFSSNQWSEETGQITTSPNVHRVPGLQQQY